MQWLTFKKGLSTDWIFSVLQDNSISVVDSLDITQDKRLKLGFEKEEDLMKAKELFTICE